MCVEKVYRPVAPSDLIFPQNFFVAAQKGDVDTLKRLIESGKAAPTDRDEQNITALHWAAINAQISACKYLLDQGAEVDALGGDLVATPMQWAARNGYLYVIQLLIAHGADPNVKDSQGYNSLHLVTHSSVVMALLYMLQQPVAVDSADVQGHTALMWAAYQGDALSVDVLLKHGAGVNTKDFAGLTPLHWAVVRGNKLCIRNLLECGADITAKDENGKTAKDMATELKSLGSYRRAFEEAGLNENGSKKANLLSDVRFFVSSGIPANRRSQRNTKFAVFVAPIAFLYLIFLTLRILPWYTGILLALAEFFGMHHVNCSTYHKSQHF
jgi:ankyrin repeat protein